MANEKNVYGRPLQLCCGNSGFTREGFCYVPKEDFGNHSICAVVDEAFLAFSYSQGNNLTSARPDLAFPGLKPGNDFFDHVILANDPTFQPRLELSKFFRFFRRWRIESGMVHRGELFCN